ncbi:MAG: helix-turn-helix transcriptional regulator [Alphaproteobacteria bacterium]|jgi:DNA-binding CsgD family transcriptional regulator|uniref:HTH-type transcriptional regulator n=1 Tax=Brevundimonas mediterranea TaxID=74329 RepID=A0A7Z8Y6M5_9CAUL|nr:MULTISPECIES: helix-turn-helix transcriptional regulator [Brevundimonas]MBU4195129.1 helix-turn-helix transcriptional regulator [Alphaproteobacteria bacterium]OGN48074.1 MAG: helix-turn-helix transcriptional regulator [Caulobacterales bacterium RIFCSPHIGHO2_12_FULL_68_13]MBU4239771.1 helix-turn-helix transcriptional regulator [Alphaproteobacteria bacterium]MCG2665017.1 helix-turn-helix transcriptional regulator [Brevundimonas sp.]VDC51937.1 Putative HTH-type transcriptional regulator [Brevu
MPESLSPREIECVRLAGLGLEDKEIAARLGISPRTVGNHLHRAYVKLKVSDRRLAARRLSNGYSGEPILIPEPAEDGLVDAASAGQSDDDGPVVRSAWSLPAPPRGVGARLAVIVAGAAVALLLAIGIVTAGMVVPSLFDRIAPEWAR